MRHLLSARTRAAGASALRAASLAMCMLSPDLASAFDVDVLMQALAQRGSGEARFTERRESSLLTEALHSSGTLTFRSPDFLQKQVLEPRAERFVVEGGQLTLDYGQKTPRRLRLDDFAPLRAMVEAFRAALSGDRKTLERYFELALEGDAGNWRLRLEPRDPRLAKQVSAVVLAGRHGVLREVETIERGGDRALLRLEHANPSGKPPEK